ncbi:hypothetical protein ILYODFUR_013907 [Ilyodon furcidens]|uniref:Uncharacterized protein n=1 Tax=Ilyodon furcidens TaxID=33524 RepID=A0ABV0TB89_9TELE
MTSHFICSEQLGVYRVINIQLLPHSEKAFGKLDSNIKPSMFVRIYRLRIKLQTQLMNLIACTGNFVCSYQCLLPLQLRFLIIVAVIQTTKLQSKQEIFSCRVNALPERNSFTPFIFKAREKPEYNMILFS